MRSVTDVALSTAAVSVLTRTVSLSVHVVVASPLASLTLVVGFTVPPPVDGDQVTVIPPVGTPLTATCTLAGTVVPTTAVRSAKPESTLMLGVDAVGGGGVTPPVDPVELLSEPHAATATAAENARREERERIC
jgi:hypothetical protein